MHARPNPACCARSKSRREVEHRHEPAFRIEGRWYFRWTLAAVITAVVYMAPGADAFRPSDLQTFKTFKLGSFFTGNTLLKSKYFDFVGRSVSNPSNLGKVVQVEPFIFEVQPEPFVFRLGRFLGTKKTTSSDEKMATSPSISGSLLLWS